VKRYGVPVCRYARMWVRGTAGWVGSGLWSRAVFIMTRNGGLGGGKQIIPPPSGSIVFNRRTRRSVVMARRRRAEKQILPGVKEARWAVRGRHRRSQKMSMKRVHEDVSPLRVIRRTNQGPFLLRRLVREAGAQLKSGCSRVDT